MASLMRIDIDLSSDNTLTPPAGCSLLVVAASSGNIGQSYNDGDVKWGGVNLTIEVSAGVPGQHSNCGIYLLKHPSLAEAHLTVDNHEMIAAYWIGGADTVNPVGDTDTGTSPTVTHAKAWGCLAIYAGCTSGTGTTISGATQDDTAGSFYVGVAGHEQQGYPGDVSSSATISGGGNISGVGITITNASGGGKPIRVW